MGVDPALGSLDLPPEYLGTWHMYTDAHIWTEFHDTKFVTILPRFDGLILSFAIWVQIRDTTIAHPNLSVIGRPVVSYLGPFK